MIVAVASDRCPAFRRPESAATEGRKPRPPVAMISRWAELIAPFGSLRTRKRFCFPGRQRRGCRLRRDDVVR